MRILIFSIACALFCGLALNVYADTEYTSSDMEENLRLSLEDTNAACSMYTSNCSADEYWQLFWKFYDVNDYVLYLEKTKGLK